MREVKVMRRYHVQQRYAFLFLLSSSADPSSHAERTTTPTTKSAAKSAGSLTSSPAFLPPTPSAQSTRSYCCPSYTTWASSIGEPR